MVELLMQHSQGSHDPCTKGMLHWGDARHTLTQATSVGNRQSMLYLQLACALLEVTQVCQAAAGLLGVCQAAVSLLEARQAAVGLLWARQAAAGWRWVCQVVGGFLRVRQAAVDLLWARQAAGCPPC